MEISDLEAIADYWLRQAELRPEEPGIRETCSFAVADFLIAQALNSDQHPEKPHEQSS